MRTATSSLQTLSLVLLTGAVARTPEFRKTASGVSVLDLTIAGEQEVILQTGDVKMMPFFQSASLVGPLASDAQRKGIEAGDLVTGIGHLNFGTWTDEVKGKCSKLTTRLTQLETGAYFPEVVTHNDGSKRMVGKGGRNTVTVIAHLTNTPVVTDTDHGPVARFGLAVNEIYTVKGVRRETTHYIEANAWRDLAAVAALLEKGRPVQVEGRLINTSFTRNTHVHHTNELELTLIIPLLSQKPSAQAPRADVPAQATGQAAGQELVAAAPVAAPVVAAAVPVAAVTETAPVVAAAETPAPAPVNEAAAVLAGLEDQSGQETRPARKGGKRKSA